MTRHKMMSIPIPFNDMEAPLPPVVIRRSGKFVN